ncbi:ABC transporter permease [Lentibacillus sediminis]|uniref:ABC transporter permease n=1 Tax=Lentibacillus sediminis TaxID=1940529 RepID=UPI000C1C46BB|nr:ABC transporter permease [Lentibacillus sediminis]
MKAKQLIKKRALQEFHLKWGVFRSVLDWSVIVYMVLPVLVILPFVYIEAWTDINLYWNENLPYFLLVAALLLLASSGNFRTFLLEADLLFLIQKRALLRRMKQHGFLLSFVQAFFSTMLLVVLALPVFAQAYDASFTEVLSIFLALLSFNLFGMSIRRIAKRKWHKWFLILVSAAVYLLLIVNMPPYFLGSITALLAIVIMSYHLTRTANTTRATLKELEIEREEKNKYIKLILNFSTETEKPVVYKRNTPYLLFRNSENIFKERNSSNGLLELIFKAFLRNKTYLISYYQVVIVAIIAISLLPFWLKWVVFLCFVFFLNSWLKNLFHKLTDDEFFSVVPFDPTLKTTVWPRFRKWTMVPAVVLTGLQLLLLMLFQLFT